jgi:hypothetical protein
VYVPYNSKVVGDTIKDDDTNSKDSGSDTNQLMSNRKDNAINSKVGSSN